METDMRDNNNIALKLWKKFSAFGLLVSLFITIASLVLLYLGFVPCIVTFVLGVIMVLVSVFSYHFDTVFRK